MPMSSKVAALVTFGAGLTAVIVAANPPQASKSPLEVHEWGTFTCLQDEKGNAIGGINTDDEPVPAFVHEVYPQLLNAATELPPELSVGGKGILPQCIEDVTMRLETPVVYFHLPPDARQADFDVSVRFNGGWLTQFYPDAAATAPGLTNGRAIGPLHGSTVGELHWNHLQVETVASGAGPVTQDPVWTSPRHVNAAPLAIAPTAAGAAAEHEQFLFYRGVGHIDAPLGVTRANDADDLLELHARSEGIALKIVATWLADIRPDGTLAFRSVEPFTLSPGDTHAAAQVESRFAAADYSAAAGAELRQKVNAALRAEGMNEDEAEALLATWQHSYFQSAGLRLLFVLPRAWTDAVLPLHVSGAEPLTLRRAMVGRIEIVSAAQRALLKQIAAGPFGGTAWMSQVSSTLAGKDGDFTNQLRAGRISLAGLNVPVPADYAAYGGLGRFRQALLLHEQEQHVTPALNQFIAAYKITAYRPAPAVP